MKILSRFFNRMRQKRNLLDIMIQNCNIIYIKCAVSAFGLTLNLYSGCLNFYFGRIRKLKRAFSEQNALDLPFLLSSRS